MRFGVASSSSKNESKVPEMVVAMTDEFLVAPMPEPKAVKSTMLPHKPEEALLDTPIPKTKGEMPLDCKRMAYGGFKTLVEA